MDGQKGFEGAAGRCFYDIWNERRENLSWNNNDFKAEMIRTMLYEEGSLNGNKKRTSMDSGQVRARCDEVMENDTVKWYLEDQRKEFESYEPHMVALCEEFEGHTHPEARGQLEEESQDEDGGSSEEEPLVIVDTTVHKVEVANGNNEEEGDGQLDKGDPFGSARNPGRSDDEYDEFQTSAESYSPSDDDE